jgi:hypothetical protein
VPGLPSLPAPPSLPGVTGGSQISVGPIPFPGVSLKVCVDGTCRTAAGVTSLTVTLKGSATLLGTPPLLLPMACTSGTGIGVKTVPGSLGSVTGSIKLTTSSGTVTVPVSQSVSTTRGLTVSACSTT